VKVHDDDAAVSEILIDLVCRVALGVWVVEVLEVNQVAPSADSS
jgi:hypothetical protein